MNEGSFRPPENQWTFSSQPSVPKTPRKRLQLLLPVVLLLFTVLTTLYCGFLLNASFVANGPDWLEGSPFDDPWWLLQGWPFSLTLLLILLAHEMGHYLSCRFYGIDATLPYLIPAPPIPLGGFLQPLNPFGTFGAVIRIRSAFQNRRQLFDVGIAGPIAGFAVIVPALVLGVTLSKDFVTPDADVLIYEFGEPLILKLAVSLFYTAGDGSNITLHPIGMAAWFGMLATSLNLLPFGQLDGGHVVYALFGPRVHRIVSSLTFAGLIAIGLMSLPTPAYVVFALFLLLIGRRHPPPIQEYEEPGSGRRLVALLGLMIFSLTFIPVPIRIVETSIRL